MREELQFLALVEHYNVRLIKYFFIPVLIVLFGNHAIDEKCTLLHIFLILGYVFEAAIANTAHHHTKETDQLIYTAPYAVFVWVNAIKPTTAGLIAFTPCEANYTMTTVCYTIIGHSVLSWIYFATVAYISLGKKSAALLEYRTCRRTMEGILPITP